VSNEKILVVDDEENIIDLVRLYLEQDGFRVASAFDGATALSKMSLHS
jgi:DNA-binding response OmpR family regulator